MKLLAFSTFDEVAGVFGTPIFVSNKGIAVRSFGDAVAQKGTPLHDHAGDYKLFQLGEYDTETGALISLPQPVFLHRASEFKEVSNG